jgi:hypothetical protein
LAEHMMPPELRTHDYDLKQTFLAEHKRRTSF